MFAFVVCAFRVIFKNHCSDPRELSPTASSSFSVSGLTFMPLVHFKLNFYGINVEFHSYSCEYPVFSAPFIKDIVFPHCVFFAQCSVDCRCVGLFLVTLLCSIGQHICFYASAMLFDCYSFVVYSSQVLWDLQDLLKIALAIWGVFGPI
jgi:hypothetical protein